MGLLSKTLLVLVAVVAVFVGRQLLAEPPKIDVVEDGWYGTGSKKPDNVKIDPFRIAVHDEILKDLKERLGKARIGHAVLEDSPDFYYGFNVDYLRKVADHWATKYDWRKYEAVLNNFPQFTTQIEGLKIHFIHSKAAKGYKTVHPVLIVHGWPGNVFEFYKFIPILNDPKAHGINVDFAFDVVAPSIPGYGWSESPKKTGFSQVAAARVFRKLLLRLGKDKFYLQGGDWGAAITSNLAKLYPQNVLGRHLNTIFLPPQFTPSALFYTIVGSIIPQHVFSNENYHTFNFFTNFLDLIKETGYMHLQATKPDTIGTALNDSPLGLAAYILEKFSTWTNYDYRSLPDGGLTKKFSLDEVLTIVTIYWVNGNIAASQRFYREFFLDKTQQALDSVYTSVPTGHAHFTNELYDRTPPELYAPTMNLTHRADISNGGHFAAFEEPRALAGDFFTFVGKLH